MEKKASSTRHTHASPVCVRRCAFRWELLVYVFPQPLKVHVCVAVRFLGQDRRPLFGLVSMSRGEEGGVSSTRWPAAGCCGMLMAASSPNMPVNWWWCAPGKGSCMPLCGWGNPPGAHRWCGWKLCGSVREVELLLRSSGLSGGVMLPSAACGEFAIRGCCSYGTMHETFPSCLILVRVWGTRPVTGPYVSMQAGSAFMLGSSANKSRAAWKGVELIRNLPWMLGLFPGRKLVSTSERRSSAIMLL